jgi:hypothetical protein
MVAQTGASYDHQMDPATSRNPGPDRFLIGIVAGAILLILVALGAVLVARQRPPVAVDPASPVGVVQGYVEAVRAGDGDRAKAYLTRAARESSERQKGDGPRFVDSSRSERRILVSLSSESADRAEVKVTVSTFSARTDPFSSNSYHNELTVHLQREDGQWRISQPADPYAFLY